MRTALATQKVSGAAAGAIVGLRTGAARDVRIYEVGVTAASAVSGTVGLGRPANTPVASASAGPTGAGLAYDNAGTAGTTALDTTWTTAPTSPTIFWRRFVLPATIGAGVIWTFPSGLVLPVSSSIVLWQISTAAVTYEVYFEFEE